uniref:phosphoribosyl-ATP diphosphatase n=1 Tax=Pararhizobium sp. IMCC3301 TaxID=3067904 RepID=UPI0027408FE6|nr:phosphoribosyl-ATP diphosphatase [Pararhizobium sp. IMCC3301]
MSNFSLSDLQTIIEERSTAGVEASYTARLLDKGVLKCAEKFGEEAVELALAAVAQEQADVANEAADVLYHLMVVLRARGVELAQIMAILEQRTAQSGLAEKAGRSAPE